MRIRVNPILHGFAQSYELFYGEFSKINGNYKSAFIFRNPAFSRDRDTNLTLDENFFGEATYNAYKNQIRTLKFCDCFTGNRVKSIDELLLVGIRLLPACWIRLQSALLLARNRLQKNDISDSVSMSIEAFLDTVKKGSKKFRNILERKNYYWL